ncbi:MAG: spermidine synthase [Actinomycetota bacterium]|nr:spermidine synthase [Actinomycetota bacterium]
MRAKVELLLASFLMLFTELVLIRWTGANVTYLSYFSNFVLLGSFLGIGIGFLRAKKGPDLFRWSPILLAFFTGFITAFPVVIDRSGSGLVFFGSLQQKGLPLWLMLPLIFLAVAAIMAAIAQGVAVRFAGFEPLEAYRLDILGSLLGIVAFAALAFVGTTPLVWGIVIGALLLFLLRDSWMLLQVVAVVALISVLTVGSFKGGVFWSPYYKIQMTQLDAGSQGPAYQIDVNGIPHQTMERSEVRQQREPIYFVPYQRIDANPLRNVLIVGAGTGSDTAIALRSGAQHVDAVEIDPKLQALGRQYHPDQPYEDPRVTAIVNDGRAYLENTDTNYDLILFALPDSLTLVGGQSAIRLESYLFTQQAFQAAKDHLSPGGSFAIYNYYREQWLLDRLAGTLQTVFGKNPCLDQSDFTVGNGIGGFSMLMDSANPGALTCKDTWSADDRTVVAPATDDHPFVYLRTRTIPIRYVEVLGLVLIVSLIVVRAAGGPLRRMRGDLDLFFMGAAFLLLETKSVVQFALLFGTTWFVNALVFAGILLTVLIAIEVERHVRIGRRTALFGVLFAALALAYLIPADSLLGLSFAPRFAAATALAFAPVFLANLIFAERFRDTSDPTSAFGANLLGAMVGGTLEYMSLVTGYRALLIVAGLLYLLAYAFGRRSLTGQTESDSPRPAREAVGSV